MNRLLILIANLVCWATWVSAQQNSYTLSHYLETARENSPMIQDYRNQQEIQLYDVQRLKAVYTRSKIELNGDYLFVPIISKDNGKTSFEWNPRDGNNYYGYDLGQSSGHLQTGISLTQPLLGNGSYKVAKQQAEINRTILDNNIHMEVHNLERAVTEQYVLCLLDKEQIQFADSIHLLLDQQTTILRRLAENGFAKQSDLQLIAIEQSNNNDLIISSHQSYRTHLMDLNILCGIKDTTLVMLENIRLSPHYSPPATSSFMERYRLDSLNALASLRSFNIQYRPSLNLFIDGGMRTSEFNTIPKHFGMSAGITFSWLLFDGRQKRLMERQTQVKIHTISVYKENFITENELRKHQYLTELKTYDDRSAMYQNQLAEYDRLLSNYRKEMQAGQISAIDYITVLRNRIQAEKEYILLKTNRELLMNAFNYWNW